MGKYTKVLKIANGLKRPGEELIRVYEGSGQLWEFTYLNTRGNKIRYSYYHKELIKL